MAVGLGQSLSYPDVPVIVDGPQPPSSNLYRWWLPTPEGWRVYLMYGDRVLAVKDCDKSPEAMKRCMAELDLIQP